MVYFITDGNFIKIGKSKNPLKRIRALQTSNPKPLRFIYVFDIHDSYEKRLHKLFKRYKTKSNNEWFDLKTICIKTNLNKINCTELKDKDQAEHRAKLLNIKIYGNVKDFRNQPQRLSHVKKSYKKNNSQIKNLIKEVKLLLKRKSVISYKNLIKKYNFTQAEISYYIKSAGLSKQIFNHNKKYFR